MPSIFDAKHFILQDVITTISNVTESTSTTTGSLVIGSGGEGGVGIASGCHIGGDLVVGATDLIITSQDLQPETLTSNTDQGYVCSSSSLWVGFQPHHAFDRDSNTRFVSVGNSYNTSGVYLLSESSTLDTGAFLGEYLQLEFPYDVYIDGYKLQVRVDIVPLDFKLAVSLDGLTWIEVSDQTPYSGTALTDSATTTPIITCDTGMICRYVRLICNSLVADAAAVSFQVRQLFLYGTRCDTKSIKTGILQATGNVQIDGNLVVNGVMNTVSSVAVEDSIIELAFNNSADTINSGFLMAFDNGTPAWGGLLRAGGGGYYLLGAETTKPTTSTTLTGLNPYGNLTVNNLTVANDLILTTSTPASATATGTAGTLAYDASYIYVCISTDVWKRSAISTW